MITTTPPGGGRLRVLAPPAPRAVEVPGLAYLMGIPGPVGVTVRATELRGQEVDPADEEAVAEHDLQALGQDWRGVFFACRDACSEYHIPWPVGRLRVEAVHNDSRRTPCVYLLAPVETLLAAVVLLADCSVGPGEFREVARAAHNNRRTP